MKNQVNSINSSGFEVKSLSTKTCGLRQSTRLNKKAINAIITDEDYSDRQMKNHYGTQRLMKIETSTTANSKEQSPNPPASLRIESTNLGENRSPTQIEIRKDCETPTTNTLLEK